MDNDDLRKLSENVIRLQEQVSTMQNTIKDLVTRAEFTPVKMIAYGLATAVMSSVMMAILAKVVIK
ncbi:hypothetical protein D3C76_388850 [compost metagenome]